MNANRWRLLTTLLWILALALAAWSLRQLPLGEIASQIAGLRWHQWLGWTAINLLILYLAVKRWQILALSTNARLSLAQLFCLRQGGSAVSFLTPGPHFGGEPLQLYWLHRHHKLSLHQAGATLGLDRFMETGVNMAVLLGCVLALLGSTVLPDGNWIQISMVLGASLLLMLIALLMLMRHPRWLAKKLQPLTELLRSVWQVHKAKLACALILSLLTWLVLFIELMLLMSFTGLAPSIAQLLLIMIGMRLAMLLPVPGGIGTIEASLLWSFTVLGFPVAAAAGLIALVRLRDAIVLLIGLGCLAALRRPATTATI
ncbi:lysylphosphatidylglycerol synthase transmembrane domain-containing protein [Pseudohongiella spirulinae]|uniref:Integral membrane protein n=1 Tax=Pseudohongiella spirulinae TaxID=1249552 RepID=A0A0S2KBV6_9GAMM|nr:lysylphosphatidylglycerol synthase transmembrane domain-containing protein [Pseudohongiella spirulinae]ALO45804.1 hypothetical protein PS2015_1144 [Pseudohongiella spirulinae]